MIKSHYLLPRRRHRWISCNARSVLLGVAPLMGLLLALAGDAYHGDSVSYLDMGDAFFAGKHTVILNGLWSPLFPFLHGLVRWLLKPSFAWDNFTVQLTNLSIYMATLLSFHFFWSYLLRAYRLNWGGSKSLGGEEFSDNEFWILGYAIFLFLQVEFVAWVTPDLLLSGTIYISAALLIKIKLDGPTRTRFLLLGLILGLGFLTKAILLPLAPVFLLSALVTTTRKHWVALVLSAMVAFVSVAGPYIFALSLKEGRFTTGDSGRLNYAWHVNGTSLIHWQGEGDSLGTPKHPTRLLCLSPLIYEFGSPVSGTYPPWTDPAYWNDGLKPRFNLHEQLGAFKVNLGQYLRSFWSQSVLIAGVMLLFLMRPAPQLRDLSKTFILWAPSIAAFALYMMVWVEGRYLSGFLTLVWGAFVSVVRLSQGADNRRLLRVSVIVIATLLNIRSVVKVTQSAVLGHAAKVQQEQIAQGLTAMGLVPGEKVAVLSAGLGEGWQKLAKLHIVAEIPEGEDKKFWTAQPERRQQIYEILAKSGANFIVATNAPDGTALDGWDRIDKTSAVSYDLRRLR